MRQLRSARPLGFALVVVALLCAALLGSPAGVDAGGSEISLKTSKSKSITAFIYGAGLRPSFVRLRPDAKVLHADLSAGDLHVVALGLSPVTVYASGEPNGAAIALSGTGYAVHLGGDEGGPKQVRTGILW
jgi:hypothetical protein